MGKSKLEKILSESSSLSPKKKSYKPYYAGIGAAFAAGNIMAYVAYGMHGLFDAMGIDFITLGFTVYQQLKIKQEKDELKSYFVELEELEEKEKICLMSFGDKKASDSKAKKISFITYELLKKDIGEQPEIEEALGISSNIIDTLENKGYIKKGLLGTKLTKKGRIVYSIILSALKDEKKDVLLMLNKLYKVPEDELLPVYQLYIDTLSAEKAKSKS